MVVGVQNVGQSTQEVCVCTEIGNPYSAGCVGGSVKPSRGGSNPPYGTTVGVDQGALDGCDDVSYVKRGRYAGVRVMLP